MVQTTDKAALRVLKDSYGPDHATLRDKAAPWATPKGERIAVRQGFLWSRPRNTA